MKKIWLCIISIAFISIHSFAQDTRYSVVANFTGMQTNDGKLFVALYNTEKSFLKTPYKTAIIDIKDLTASVKFSGLIEGEYAISAFHDANNNSKLDSNFIGIPKEAIGISNNTKGFMGAPKYKKAKFLIHEKPVLEIKMASIF